MSDLHPPADEAVIAAELVACTLGERRRPELDMTLDGALTRFAVGLSLLARDAAPLLKKIGAALAAIDKDKT